MTTLDIALPAPRRFNQESQALRTLRRLMRHRGALIGGGMVVSIGLAAILGPLLAPFDPAEMGVGASLSPPSPAHFFGTDTFGRDIFSRVLHGAQLSLMVGLVAVVIEATVGVLLGLIAGYYGGWIDGVLMRIIDVLLAFPGILLALAIVSVLGISLTNLMIAVGIGGIPSFARLIRGSTLTVKENLYVTVARSIGAGDASMITRHILPNVASPIIVYATLRIAFAIIATSSLSFLGLGAKPPSPEWGVMLSDGREFLRIAPWVTTFPGLAIMFSVMGINLLGDGLRDVLDPRLRV
ncbi:MAG TPA: ABC transporter permease [Chloroflexota bacterium]|jgi:peptide/nickel transport system permease protein|nr:ABC transporter permease [Chloroflexota bacterium]